ncbi:hypothetical protein AOR13_1174 [Alteromonas stellipolaris LMG 21856]|nr:hypothetical protein AOR13_1174 [Alteromonas stellipolaris LMG 21856]
MTRKLYNPSKVSPLYYLVVMISIIVFINKAPLKRGFFVMLI